MALKHGLEAEFRLVGPIDPRVLPPSMGSSTSKILEMQGSYKAGISSGYGDA